EGRLVSLVADRAHPVSPGFVCNKGLYGADLHNDPDRLWVPLKRMAPGRFEPVSWDEALVDIAQRLRATLDRHGAGAVASYTGNPAAFNSLFGQAFGGFLSQLGVRTSFSSGTQDCANKFAGSEAVFGTRTLHPLPDIDRAELIVLFGENPAVSHMSFVSMAHPMKRLKDAQARGARIVYVNPRRIESAAIAGEVLPIKPDTDVYLLAALLHVIERGPGFDAAALQRHGRNVDALRAFIAPWTPERVAPVTGIPAETIRALARDFAAAPAACAHMSTGVNMGRQGTLAYWLLHMLVFVTGNLGRPGGNFYSQGFYTRSTAAGANGPRAMLDSAFGRMRQPGGVGIGLPGTLLAEHVLRPDGPIRAMFVNSGNPVLSIAGEARLREAFASLELLVCVDIYRNATAEYAHYILPATGAYEREDINITGLGMQDQPSVQFTEAMVPPAYERRPEWWIYGMLARQMGLRSPLDDGEAPELWARTDAMLRSRGQSMATLREAGVLLFPRTRPETFFDEHLPTEDHRVDCCPADFAEAIARMDTLFDELAAEPPGQLKLISKRDAYMLNSWYGNLPKLKAQGRDHNPLFMHPDDARARQIADGDRVRIANRFGTVEAPVRLSAQLMPGVVAMTHGWGQGASPGLSVAQRTAGVNCNVLLPSGPGAFEPISNQSHMTGIPVEVRPV
ncbi:MAG: molybdopterin-dependent oxidoreductase, partial [Burkholderiaceae bacterium]|nr:molybdopterin-dependent oxidoreductase [Burkholderiaceae bacterium]